MVNHFRAVWTALLSPSYVHWPLVYWNNKTKYYLSPTRLTYRFTLCPSVCPSVCSTVRQTVRSSTNWIPWKRKNNFMKLKIGVESILKIYMSFYFLSMLKLGRIASNRHKYGKYNTRIESRDNAKSTSYFLWNLK
jgi:hypothetical protein